MTDINTTSMKLEVVRLRARPIHATSLKLEVIRNTSAPPPPPSGGTRPVFMLFVGR